MIVNHISREAGARRLNIRDLSRLAGVSYSAMHPLYHDRVKRLDLETLDRLCRALGCGVGDLFEYRRDEGAESE